MIAKNNMELLSLFTTLGAEFKSQGVRVTYKDGWWWKLTTKRCQNRVSQIGDKIIFPSKEWIDESPLRAIGMLCHDFVHFLDKERDGIRYGFRYWGNRMWRRRYEMRGFVLNLLIGLMYARPSEDVFDKLATIMTQPIYFGMFRDHRDAVIEAKLGYAYTAGIAHELLERRGIDQVKMDRLLSKDEAYCSQGLQEVVKFLASYVQRDV